MACHFNDNVYTKTFTPREYQVELLDTALERNTIVSLDSSSAKTFIAIKLLQELATSIRLKENRHSIFIMNDNNVEIMASHIKHLTDLSVQQFDDSTNFNCNNEDILYCKVVVISLTKWVQLLSSETICLSKINLLVIDDWLQGSLKVYDLFKEMMVHYSRIKTDPPRILGLTRSMLCDESFCAANLEAGFKRVENLLSCSIDTSSEIVSLLRYSSKPKEKIIVSSVQTSYTLKEQILIELQYLESFLDDHRYDPSEIYDDEFNAELSLIPNPKTKPKEILNDMKDIVCSLGAWAADQAAFNHLSHVEKLKVKVPYERHFLLLCLVTTVLVKIRAICDDAFGEMSDLDKITHYSTPKILRFLEILKQFKPEAGADNVIATATEVLDNNIINSSNCDRRTNEGGQATTLTATVDDNNKNEATGNSNCTDGGVTVKLVAPPAPGYGQFGAYKSHKGRGGRPPRRIYQPRPQQDDALCALVFVKNRFVAKVIYQLIYLISQTDKELAFLSPLYIVDKIADPVKEATDAEKEHKRQEDVLRKFRMHECNILVANSILEEGIDIPKCNLVIRFDIPRSYYSYVQCKGRARAVDASYLMLVDAANSDTLVDQLAEYIQIETILLARCKNLEPTDAEEREADKYTNCWSAFKPSPKNDAAFVNLVTAITLVNRYCAKLPSDTFTRLTPIWSVHEDETASNNKHTTYYCKIRLPINSPVKQTIIGPSMPSKVLARRAAAFKTCQFLHHVGELDNNLLPIGKESFRASEEDWNSFPLEPADELLTKENAEPRPGTTKRRQYYYKKIANSLTDCRPIAGKKTYFYHIKMVLTCPLPEEQNTRGRKIYPPEESVQGFGILTLKEIPKICPFPIFTRSGEVSVSLQLCSSEVILTLDQLDKISEFLHYTFTSVLRLQKYLMLFDPKSSENSYLIVPTLTNKATEIDWKFLELIYDNRNLRPQIVPEEARKDFKFEPDMYKDAVVMPWYRNQDQPQYFYVAEICNYLNPKSSFPGSEYSTFEEYYLRKYDIQIQNLEQQLLDVDHTSARLNFLTPRYVNRKGVALPTSSEETKRAKRENLEQKQILVPELCAIHPFPASLWRKAVCLPCILYRINALLLADQIRKKVALDIGLGLELLSAEFEWTPLNFGWTLSDVLKKSKEKEMLKEATKDALDAKELALEIVDDLFEMSVKEQPKIVELNENGSEVTSEDTAEEEADDEAGKKKDWMEIGTWSNEMAGADDADYANAALVRYGSPTSWLQTAYSGFDDFSDSDDDYYMSDPDESDSNKSGGLRIEFTGDNTAEAIDDESLFRPTTTMLMITEGEVKKETFNDFFADENVQRFSEACQQNVQFIRDTYVVADTERFVHVKRQKLPGDCACAANVLFEPISLQDCIEKHNVHVETDTGDSTPLQLVPFVPESGGAGFYFDSQPDLRSHPGPSPSVILQALTMSNANDGINLERLETIGDSFLKYAITNYLYSTYDNIHEGKLSHLRSKQVSNLNLYRLGRRKLLGESMIATKFDPHDNWQPPCHYVPKDLEQALIDADYPASHWNRADMPTVKDMSKDEISQMVKKRGEMLGFVDKCDDSDAAAGDVQALVAAAAASAVSATATASAEAEEEQAAADSARAVNLDNLPIFIPYNLITQHSIPDKSVADCVEALIGAYLIECGPRGALLFMAWLGIRVLPIEDSVNKQTRYGHLKCPKSPLLRNVPNPEMELRRLLDGYGAFEESIHYEFRDKSYLLQAFTHASYSPNMLTDCYQRLEFLGDAVLDYLITRHLYEDNRMHSPGALTDLRSALVNNTIFASLAVRHGFHKYFRHLSPGLHEVIDRFVRIQEENGHQICEEYYLIEEDECEEVEDVEVPKALGDVFESVAGAIFLDSGMSLHAVWQVYFRMMQKEIEQFSNHVPKSPIRELLELEPETAKFGKPEKLADGRRVRVTVEVFGKGVFKGIGRNYRIAKCTAAKCALKHLKRRGLILRRN